MTTHGACAEETMSRIPILATIAAFLLLIPWVGMLHFDLGRIQVDGIYTTAAISMTLAVFFSMASWWILSRASKDVRSVGILLSIITGASLVIPFIQVLGPMAAVLVGIVAGFSAFMLQKKAADPARNRPVIVAAAALAAAYLALTILVLVAQSSHTWDAGDGIGAWTGTAEGIEESGFDNIFNSNIGFAYFLAVIPALAVAGLMLRGGKMKTRYKIIIIAVLSFAILDLPFFMSITVVEDALGISPILHFWSIPIHTEVSGMKPAYEAGEPIEFAVTHYNFGYYQEYLQYEIFRENDRVSVIRDTMTDGPVSYGPFTILMIWPGNWEISSYTEDYFVDQYGNRIDSKPQDDAWSVVSETKPITVGEPGKYTLHVCRFGCPGEISIPFEVVEDEI